MKSSLSSYGTSYLLPTCSSSIHTNLCIAPTLLLVLLSQEVCLCPTKALCASGRFKIIFSRLSKTSMTCAQQGTPSRPSRVSRRCAALGRMDPDRLAVSTHLFPHLDSNFFPLSIQKFDLISAVRLQMVIRELDKSPGSFPCLILSATGLE